MDPPEVFATSGGGLNRPPPRKELQGLRPAVLKVNKDSYKIGKPPVPPSAHSQAPQEPPPEYRQPVIIYAVSPKVIHTTVTDFMKLVQRLTGNASSADNSGGAAGDLSPAARIASIEQTSASPKDREIITANRCNPTEVDDVMCNILESTDIEVCTVSGILSPAPAVLQPLSPELFSLVADPFSIMGYNNMFIPSPSALFSSPMVSPSALFSAPMVSPSPSYCDLFNPFFDF